MATAYTPGLRVAKRTLVKKLRMLPLKGDVKVAVGATVRAEDVVAETALPGDVESVNVVNRLGCTPQELTRYMLKKEGDAVEKGETIARSTSFFGVFKTDVASPLTGTVERVSDVTGQVLLRKPPKPVSVRAFTGGRIAEVHEGEGVTIETQATFIQGIFGVGLETWGDLVIATNGPADELAPERIGPEHAGKIVVGGSLVPFATIEKAKKLGVKGIVAGGLHDADLKKLLGYDLGVAVTGQENLGITVVVTEGFGKIAMAERTFELLRSRASQLCSLSAATQIRAGVMRPEIILPYADGAADEAEAPAQHELRIGDPVRCIRKPYFGKIGKVVALPVELTQVESETWVRVLAIDFGDGHPVTTPRANVEVVES